MNNLGKMQESLKEDREWNDFAFIENDWNEQGAIKLQENTFELVSNFCLRLAEYFDLLNKEIFIPTIGPCADGSLDIYFDYECANKFRLLMNLQPNGDIIDYYGERGENKIKGESNIFDFDFSILEEFVAKNNKWDKK